jgi:transcription elongation factor Elf1
MNCPYCNHQDHMEVDLHADGFCADLIECSDCGALLTLRSGELLTVHGPAKSLGVLTA